MSTAFVWKTTTRSFYSFRALASPLLTGGGGATVGRTKNVRTLRAFRRVVRAVVGKRLQSENIERTRRLDFRPYEKRVPNGVRFTGPGSVVDPARGLYVIFCLLPPPSHQPVPGYGNVYTRRRYARVYIISYTLNVRVLYSCGFNSADPFRICIRLP